MTNPDEWHRRQLDAAEELLDEAQVSMQQGDIHGASEQIDEALVILDMSRAEQFDDEVRRLRARALNDRGLMFQQSEQFDEARTLHTRAAELVDELDDIDPEFASSAAAIYLNVGQVALFDEDYDRARDANERAEEIVDRLRERGETGVETMALSVYQNATALESYTDHYDRAVEAAERALEIAEGLADEGMPEALGQAARVAQQLSVQLFESEQLEDAVEWGQRAESYSERAYNAIGKEALHLYVVSQINLISYYEEMRQFADAEDALWKAIDVVGPDPEVLERGQVFYEHCRKFTDEKLAEGNLPRDEVEMGYEELQELMEEHDVGMA